VLTRPGSFFLKKLFCIPEHWKSLQHGLFRPVFLFLPVNKQAETAQNSGNASAASSMIFRNIRADTAHHQGDLLNNQTITAGQCRHAADYAHQLRERWLLR
jgi:hypothetical protein